MDRPTTTPTFPLINASMSPNFDWNSEPFSLCWSGQNFPNTFSGSPNSTYSVDTEKVNQNLKKGMRPDDIPTSEMERSVNTPSCIAQMKIIGKCLLKININIKDWTLRSVPSPQLQLLAPKLLRSSNCSPSLWPVVVKWFQRFCGILCKCESQFRLYSSILSIMPVIRSSRRM